MRKSIVGFILGVLLFFLVLPIQAQQTLVVSGITQTELEKQLADIEKQIVEYQKQLTTTLSQKKTLANKINQLKIKQQELNALIKQTSFKVDKLADSISVAEKDLATNISKEDRLKKEIAVTIRLVHEKDLRPIILLALGNGLSAAFREVQQYIYLNINLKNLVDEVQKTQEQIVLNKETLEDQKQDAVQLLQIKSIQKQELVNSLGEQNSLLTKTKGLEVNYASALADSKKQAAEIRSRIYELFNTGSKVNFGQALEIANYAAKLTGIRPAFVLAVLTQESNLGKNVGTCNRAGDPIEKSWKTIMKPERDQEPFVKITKELNLNIDSTPVSCPMRDKSGKQIGWGGAMGPAQFIPSTWMGYKDKVSAITGKSPANPWDIRDAFIAASIKLRAGGADGTYNGEWKAAMIYFSGSANSKYTFYGDNVMALAEKYQKDIEQLN